MPPYMLSWRALEEKLDGWFLISFKLALGSLGDLGMLSLLLKLCGQLSKLLCSLPGVRCGSWVCDSRDTLLCISGSTSVVLTISNIRILALESTW
jgi:hypothetical protein